MMDSASRMAASAVAEFSGTSWDAPGLRLAFGGLTVLQIGTPCRSGKYPGWFVPYEIRLKDGQVRKHNLPVRNDNPREQWALDGGL